MSKEIDLSKRKCVPCEGGIDAINHKQANILIKKLASGWTLSDDSKKIYKNYKFKIGIPNEIIKGKKKLVLR